MRIMGYRLFVTVAIMMCLPAAQLPFRLHGAGNGLPAHLVPRRSSQIQDGFGINSDLPREPSIPWNRWWWTRMFDAGVNFIRIGQYENSSDYTSWDWVERRRGEYSVVPELDDYVNSLVENGMHIEIQLLYGNPLYTSPAGRLPETITPVPGSFHNPDRSLYSVFWPPRTPDQIAAFTKYAAWMANHFRGRVQFYEIWNEPNIDYWNPAPNPEEYGRLFKAAARTVHSTDPNAKVVFGGLAGAAEEFTRRALAACDCAASIDVFAYHNYPNYGHNLNPEATHKGDDGGDTNESSKGLRDLVRNYPGIRKDIAFWVDEFNDGIPSWTDSDESVQAKYIPRGLLIDRAAGLRTFVWLIVGATDGNESDDFGLLHGLMYRPDDFTPRPAFYALQNTNTLFSDTQPDPSVHIETEGTLSRSSNLRTYAFRSTSQNVIVAYWAGVLSKPGSRYPSQRVTLQIRNSGIREPVLVDITSGELTPMSWRQGTNDTLEQLPLRDSVMAVADRSYFSWPELPEAPSDLTVTETGSGTQLAWKVHEGHPEFVILERRLAQNAAWQSVAKLPAGSSSFSDKQRSQARSPLCYRVRAGNSAGNSAYSNVSCRM
jgi:polysaccharide biosynthesis protein PslG